LILTLAYHAASDKKRNYIHMQFRSNHFSRNSLTAFTMKISQTASQISVVASFAMLLKMLGPSIFTEPGLPFSHFVGSGDDSGVSTEAAYAAILRSMAFRCSHGQKAIDITIPVALKNESLRGDIMARILISVKDRVTRRSKVSKVSVDIDASKLSFFPERQELFGDTGHQRPYISLVMELGISLMIKHHATGSEDAAFKTAKGGTEVIECWKSRRCTLFRSFQTPENPHYSIYACGCPPSICKVMGKEAVFASLLSSRTLVDEHPN
jgi:hypothetical protein